MEIREVKIEEYWPLIVRGTEEFGQIAVAENPEFNLLAECVYRILKDGLIQDATEYGVLRWEKMLGLAVTADMNLDDRKVAILNYLSIKTPYTWRVLKRMLTELLGEDNVRMSRDNEIETLTVAVGLSTTRAQIADVESLLARVLPQNLVTEMEWADGLPMTYTRLDYLESTVTQYIDTGYIPNNETGLKYIGKSGYNNGYFQMASSEFNPLDLNGNVLNRGLIAPFRAPSYDPLIGGAQYSYAWNEYFALGHRTVEVMTTVGTVNWKNNRLAEISFADGAYDKRALDELFYIPTAPVLIGKMFVDNRVYPGVIFRAFISQAQIVVRDFIPALDPTGCPCMFDTVTRKPFYNSGTGQFLYPTNEAPVMSLGLDWDAKFYGKLTEHGVRRLYHVPKGCTMSMDEYAAKHGFKELVEPPMPQTGYWTNVWRETDTQLICEWVETEPPMEVTEND